MLGNMTVSHMGTGGGDTARSEARADRPAGRRLRSRERPLPVRRVYNGENWNPQLRAPLTQPGVNVKAGEYLLAVNGREVRPPENVYSFFEGTGGQIGGAEGGPGPERRRLARSDRGSRRR